MKHLTMVLMDGGSGLNIIYVETLDAMGIDPSCIQPTGAPFHGIELGKQAVPLGQINLPITFRDLTNYKMETLIFEVVGFHRTYHDILGRLCYAKFMVIPNYTYLKLKMPESHGVITVGTTFRRAYKCEVECYEHASAIIASEELTVIKEETTKEAPCGVYDTPEWAHLVHYREIFDSELELLTPLWQAVLGSHCSAVVHAARR
ncbi:uncharacterized protein [Miscanthus floridulus]|uniref:uncharacterized protein n=1 Tax=Miscanthus floridulus TaxID=154761 RepID=UPI003458AE0D